MHIAHTYHIFTLLFHVDLDISIHVYYLFVLMSVFHTYVFLHALHILCIHIRYLHQSNTTFGLQGWWEGSLQRRPDKMIGL